VCEHPPAAIQSKQATNAALLTAAWDGCFAWGQPGAAQGGLVAPCKPWGSMQPPGPWGSAWLAGQPTPKIGNPVWGVHDQQCSSPRMAMLTECVCWLLHEARVCARGHLLGGLSCVAAPARLMQLLLCSLGLLRAMGRAEQCEYGAGEPRKVCLVDIAALATANVCQSARWAERVCGPFTQAMVELGTHPSAATLSPCTGDGCSYNQVTWYMACVTQFVLCGQEGQPPGSVYLDSSS
jgi:hypothetical protein